MSDVFWGSSPSSCPPPADTTAADEAWWDQEVAEEKGNFLMEEVVSCCISCGKKVSIARWQTSNEGDECNGCIQLDATPYDC